jgi:cell division control protein 45
LNLGALVDLAGYFSYLPPTTLIHVIDSHRPINLSNLYAPSSYAAAIFDGRRRGKGELPGAEMSVVVWSDAEGDEEMRVGEREAFEALQVCSTSCGWERD